jgi:hypothetical protein
MDDETEILLFLQEIKSSPDYQDVFSEGTRRNFDICEKALSGDSEALIAISISRELY